MPRIPDGIVRSLTDLRDRMQIRHRIARYDSTRYGVVNAPEGVIEYQGVKYSLNQFVTKHYADVGRPRSANAWYECWGEFGAEWKRLLYILKE